MIMNHLSQLKLVYDVQNCISTELVVGHTAFKYAAEGGKCLLEKYIFVMFNLRQIINSIHL